jgi:hypothetical protein
MRAPQWQIFEFGKPKKVNETEQVRSPEPALPPPAMVPAPPAAR